MLSEPFMDIEQLGRQNRSSLANAALRGDDELVKLLLRHNATPESKAPTLIQIYRVTIFA